MNLVNILHHHNKADMARGGDYSRTCLLQLS